MAELVGVGAVNVTCYFLPTNRTPVKALTGRVADNGRQNVRGRQLKMLSIHCAGNSECKKLEVVPIIKAYSNCGKV